MFQIYWLALAVFALAATGAWAFIPRRTTLTTLLATFSWASLALSGGNVETITESGSTVAAGVDDSIRVFIAGLALLSFVAFALSQFGGYPPEQYLKDVPNGPQ